MIKHLVWRTEDVHNYAEAIAAGIEREEHRNELKPYFRAIVIIGDIADEFQASRVDQLLTSLVTAIRNDRLYYHATENCISMLFQYAKHHGYVLKWLQEVGVRCPLIVCPLPQAPQLTCLTPH